MRVLASIALSGIAPRRPALIGNISFVEH